MTNTGFNYPENIDEKSKEIIEDYYNTIYPDEDVREYMWFNDSLTLNGEKTTQTFLIHTGNGSNSKSSKFAMFKEALGNYFCEINPETFTRPVKSQNATSELYKTKGTRLVFFNEPDNDGDSKLQVNLLKKMADGHKGKLISRGLYMKPIEFPVLFRVECCCNNKPDLSSCDGGIGRRVRVVNYPVKFIAEPDPNNINQALLNPEMVNTLTSVEIRNTYIRLLIDKFINVSSKVKKEKIPKKIVEDSNKYVEDSNPTLGFIMENYDITNDTNDKIQSSILFEDFKYKTGLKISSSKFKDDITNIGGISQIRGTSKKEKGIMFFIGLKKREFNNED